MRRWGRNLKSSKVNERDFHRLNGRLLLVIRAHVEVQKQLELLIADWPNRSGGIEE